MDNKDIAAIFNKFAGRDIPMVEMPWSNPSPAMKGITSYIPVSADVNEPLF